MNFRVRANKGKKWNVSRECVRNIDIGNGVMDVGRWILCEWWCFLVVANILEYFPRLLHFFCLWAL